MLWLGIALAVLLLFGLTALRGAPYVPTQRRAIKRALDLLDLKPGEIVIDLGSGDGIFVKAAAKRGLRVYGYEINPLLCAVAWLRCWPYRKLVSIRWRDFWLTPLPPKTKGVFVFAAGPFMQRLRQKLEHEGKPGLKVASFGFEIPGHKKAKSADGVHLYKL